MTATLLKNHNKFLLINTDKPVYLNTVNANLSSIDIPVISLQDVSFSTDEYVLTRYLD
jgi:hypothetical protein